MFLGIKVVVVIVFHQGHGTCIRMVAQLCSIVGVVGGLVRTVERITRMPIWIGKQQSIDSGQK